MPVRTRARRLLKREIVDRYLAASGCGHSIKLNVVHPDENAKMDGYPLKELVGPLQVLNWYGARYTYAAINHRARSFEVRAATADASVQGASENFLGAGNFPAAAKFDDPANTFFRFLAKVQRETGGLEWV